MGYIGKTPTPQPLTASDIPDLSASKITSGTLADALFPSTLPAISGANLTNVSGVPSNHYTLVDVAEYDENTGYTTTSSTNQFTITDESCTLTTTAQTNGADIFLIHASLNAHSNADNNGYGLFMVHSTSSDFSSGTATTLQTGRYGEQLMNNEYRNTTGFAKLTGLTASTQYYFRMYAMIQRPSGGTISLNVDAYATSLSVRHSVVVQQFFKNAS